MKKLFVMLIIVLSLGIIGCSNVEGENINSEKHAITISKESFGKVEEMRDRVQGNSTSIYQVKNLKKGKYKVSLFMEEYKDGKFKENIGLLESEIEINEEKLYIGINKNEDDLTFDITTINGNDSTSATSNKVILDEGEDNEIGYSWAMLENSADEVCKIKLEEKLSIASCSIGKGDKTYTVVVGDSTKNAIDLDFDGETNAKDVVIYLKISKI